MSIEAPEITMTPARLGLNLDKSTWTRVRFGDAIQNVTDRVDDPSAAGVDRYVGLEQLDPGVMTVQRWDSPDKVAAQKLRFQPGDVIFGRRRAYQKKVAMAEFEGICSAHALVLRAVHDSIDPHFLPVFLSSDYFLERAISISVGSLSPTVNWRDLKLQEFSLPPLDEQKRLADLLWSLERHRTKLHAESMHLDESRDAVIHSHFPVGGSTVPLGEIAQVTSGITLGPKRKSLPKAIPYLRVANVQRGSLHTDEIKVVGATDAEVGSKGLKRGDVLVVEGHASVKEIGRAAIWDRDDSPLYQNHLFRLRPTTDLRAEYLLEWINSSAGRTYIRTVAKSTSGLYTINSTVLKAMPVPLAPRTTQDAMLHAIAQIDGARQRQAAETENLGMLRSALLAEIFEEAG